MGVQFACILGLFALQSLAMINATTICDYADCTCTGQTVSCHCERNINFELRGDHRTLPSNLTNFNLDQCHDVIISRGIFQDSNIANIDIRNCVNVTVETTGLTGVVLKHLGFHNLTLGLESNSINGNITSLQFDTVYFPKSYSSMNSIGGRYEQLISFANCVSAGMGFFSDSLKVGKFFIENSTIDRVEQHNLKFDVMYNFAIKNSHISHIEEGGIWPGWESENLQGHKDAILLNNKIGVLEKDFFNGGGWHGRFKFIENTVHLVKDGAFRPFYLNNNNEIQIRKNKFLNVEPYDLTIVVDYDRLFISDNQFHCNADLCTTLDQSLPIVKDFDVYSYFELLMFNNSQCIDEKHISQSPADVYGNYFDANECLESFGSTPNNITMMYQCTKQCSCFNYEAICACSGNESTMTPDFYAIPQNISKVTITNCSYVSLSNQIYDNSSVQHIIVKDAVMVFLYNFINSFEDLRCLKFKNVNALGDYFSLSGGSVNHGGVLTFDNVNLRDLLTQAFYSANNFGRLKVLNSNVGSVEPYAFAYNGVMNTIIFFNTTIAKVAESGFYSKNLNHFRMGFCQIEHILRNGLNITANYERQVQSVVIQGCSFGFVSEGAFHTNNSCNVTSVRKVVFSDNTVDLLRHQAFHLWQNHSDEVVFTNNTIYALRGQTSTVSVHNTVVGQNWVNCDIRLCRTLAQYFPYEREISDDFFALLAFNQSQCIASSFSDTYTSRSKSVLEVYGRFTNTAECELYFRNGTLA